MNRTIFLIIITFTFLSSFFASENNQLSLSDSINNGHGSYSYNDCSYLYRLWPCQERFDRAKPYTALCSLLLLDREVATIGYALQGRESCSQVHEIAWCSQNLWFPCNWNSCEETTLSLATNGTTVITMLSGLAALCIFTPWCTNTGCNDHDNR